MGFDGSILLFPGAVADVDLMRHARAAPGVDDVRAVLVCDETGGPAALRAALPRYAAISAWGERPGEWDATLRAICARLGGKALALSTSDAGGLDSWQVIEDGARGPAEWLGGAERDQAAPQGMLAAFGVRIDVEVARGLVADLALGARRGVELDRRQVLSPDGARNVTRALRCQLLDHPIGDEGQPLGDEDILGLGDDRGGAS